MIVRRNKAVSMELVKSILNYIFYPSQWKNDYIALFETETAKYLGVKYAVMVSSGRKGLELIIRYYNFPKGSRIIMPALTLRDLPIMVQQMGYLPEFVDVDIDTCNMDPGQLEKKINDKTTLIVATHLFGIPCQVDKILEVAKTRNIKVIEDCAHSLGATYKGKKVGTFAEASFFSLEMTKPLNTFGGGIIATNDKSLYEFIKQETAKYPYSRGKLFSKVFNSLLEDIVIHSPLYSLLGYLFYFDSTKKLISNAYRGMHKQLRIADSKYSNFQAYLGCKALREINEKNARLLSKGNKFRSYTSKNITFPIANYEHTLAYHFNLVKTDVDSKRVRKKLLERGVDAGIDDEISNNCPRCFGATDNFPNVDILWKTLVQLPMSYTLSDKCIEIIAKKLNQVVSKIKTSYKR